MKKVSIAVEFEYDHTRLSPSEILFNLKRALDDYFNRFESEYEEDALRVSEITLNENVTVVPVGDTKVSF